MSIQGKPLPVKRVIGMLDGYNMNTYGNTMLMTTFDNVINNVLPADPTCIDCKDHTLARMTYVGSYRDTNLGKGMYSGWENSVLTTQPLDKTFAKVLAYKKKASNAAIRGQTLNNSMPSSHNPNQKQNNIYFNDAIVALSKIK